ncbi:hypothetical protein KFL_005030070 [Klebsormidium nitens]|uniref:Uncharacterized protein n=1 Tax=Klebsormidium nitens TaxID=105231 RepID=A0A1Y1IE68_KLENI|nr:hypothetical protein KFL_005030070 [Klebsormidium nitens]|eukprot:GAQ89255.1 hypothetical protein KFL_005030070 [Klebsormidium nitens]
MRTGQCKVVARLAQGKLGHAKLSLFVLLFLVGTDLTQGLIQLYHRGEGGGGGGVEAMVSKAELQHADLQPARTEIASEARDTVPRTLSQQLLSFQSSVSLRGSELLSSLLKQRTFTGKPQTGEQLEIEDGDSLVLKSSSLDVALQEQLRKLNQVLATGNVQELLRFCAPNVKVDAPGRPRVQGHGAALVFALQTLFMEKGHRSVIQEEVIQLREVRLKGQNDPDTSRFLLTRNSFPVMNGRGVTQGGKAVILWQLLPGLAQTEANLESEADDAKGRLMIRWWIWNDDGDSVSASLRSPQGTIGGVRRGGMERQAAEELESSSLRSLYCSLRERWSDFNHALTRGDLTGCLDLTSPDTVIMPPGNPALRGSELKEVCEAFVQAGVTQQVDINEALLFKGRRIVRGAGSSSYTKVKYFVLENDAFINSYIQSNVTEVGKQVIFWEVHPGKSAEGSNRSPLSKGNLKWGWSIWNSDEPGNT